MKCFQISEDLARLGLFKLEGGKPQGLGVEGHWEGNMSACIKATTSSFLLSQLPHCWSFLEVYPSNHLFMCILYTCIYARVNVNAHRRQKRVSVPMELDLQAVKSHLCGC